MIYEAITSPTTYLTLVVRAETPSRAKEIAIAAAQEYAGDDVAIDVELELLDPDGPEGVLVDDPS